ncbi:MAG TPA: tagaturonate reductase, partial [Eubacteriales bacterium]|nr:tagaturonate reductase [Eubacteriales bacterium]
MNENNNFKSYPVKILQYGAGVFMRAFFDYFIQTLNEEGRFSGSVAAVNNTPSGSMDELIRQNLEYTVRLEGLKRGEVFFSEKKIASISRAINYYTDFSAYLSLAELPSLKLITSNTTEAGIVFNENDKFSEMDVTYPAKLTRFLFERHRRFSGAAEAGLYILPCELIDHNADVLSTLVKRYAELWELPPEFLSWVQNCCRFCNTLVDRIVTGYPKGKIEKYPAAAFDKLFDIAEPFGFFAIEDKGGIKEFLGGGVPEMLFAADISGYKTRKVRLLNAVHTAMMPKAIRKGYDTVGQAVADPEILGFIKEIMAEEIIPTINLPQKELKEFAEQVIDRFKNPYLEHRLLAISLNTVSKWRERILPIILDYIKINGYPPKRLTATLRDVFSLYSNGELKDNKLFCKNF